MRIIDDKGRLFGRINVIDFLLASLLISLAPMFYFGYRIFYGEPSSLKVQEEIHKEFIEIKVKGRFINLNPQAQRTIAAGDKESDDAGNVIGEIMSIDDFSPHERELDIGQDKKLINKNLGSMQAVAVLRVNAQIRGKNIYYKDKQIEESGALAFSPATPNRYSVEIEGITIVKDEHNIVVGKQEKATVEMDKNLAAVKGGLDALEKKLDNSLAQIINRLSELEKKEKGKRK